MLLEMSKSPKVAAAQKSGLLTRQQLAAALGVNAGTITRWERDGCPAAKKRTRGQCTLFDRAEVEAWRDAVEAAKKSDEGLSLEQERALLARAQREKVEMENAVRRGELWPMDLVILEGNHFAKALVAKVRLIPLRLIQAGIITREQEQGAMAQVLDILEDISQWKTVADTKKAVRVRGAA